MTKATLFSAFHPVSVIKSTFDTPFVASFPHSGMYIPPELRGMYTQAHLSRLRNTDWHLPELYSFLPSIGVDCVIANFSRYVIDVNRGLHQLHGGKTTRSQLIYFHDTEGEAIFKQETPDLKSAFRIKGFYIPYHKRLKSVIADKIARHGHAFLLDMHSFAYGTDKDIAIGDGKNRDKGPFLKKSLTQAFASVGLSAGSSSRFPGGHIVRQHGGSQCEAVMIEHAYRLYMPDSAVRGDHIPSIDWGRAKQTQGQLKRALTKVVNAPYKSCGKAEKRLAL